MSTALSSPNGTAVGSLSSLLTQNRRLKEENEALADDLAQCQVDKEFVWSLWKKLQVESPNVTEAVALVIERERQKAEVKDRKVLEILRLKDTRIEEIQKEMAQQSKELGLAVQKKLELQGSIEKLQAEKAATDARLATAAVQLDELRAAAVQRSGDVEEAERQRRSKIELTDRVAQLHAECDVLRTERDRLTSLLGEKDRLLAEQHGEATKWAGSHRTLQDKYKASVTELEVRKKRQKKAERCLREHVAALESMRTELARLREEHSRCTAAAREQQSVVQQMQALQQETEQVLRESESAHLQERASQQALYSNLNRQYSDLKVVEGQLRRTAEELEAQLQRSESEASFLRSQLQIALREKERQRAVAAQVNFPIDQEVQTKYEPDLEVRLKIEGLEDQLKLLREKVNDKNRQIDRLSQEKSELEEEQHVHAAPRRAITGTRHVRSSSEGAGRRMSLNAIGALATLDPPDLAKRLSLAERKLDDAERLLEKRNEQLESLRQAHKRRLQRLKGLLTSYRLIKEQLRIAEEELRRPPKKKMKIKRPRASELQKESNSDAAWNELNYYKNENKNLVITKMNLEEEIDDLRVRVADEAATSHELAVQLSKEQEELKQLLRREAARQGSVPTRDMRAEMQSLLTRLQESDARVEDLKVCLSELSTGKDVLEENCRRLKAEASSLRRDVTRKKLIIKGLNRKIEKLRHAVRSNLCRVPRWKRCTGSESGEDDTDKRVLRNGRIRNRSDHSPAIHVCEDADDSRVTTPRRHANENAYLCQRPQLDDGDSGSVSSAPHFSTPVAKKYERTLRRSLRKLSAAFQGKEDDMAAAVQSDEASDYIGPLPELEADRRLLPPVTSDGSAATSENSDSTMVGLTTGDSCCNQPLATSRSSDAESLGHAIARTAAVATGSQTSPNRGIAALAQERRSDEREGYRLDIPAQGAKECRSVGTSPVRAVLAVPRRSILVRPARSMLYHVSSMKQRLLSLQRQIHVLSESKAACLAEAADLRRQCESLQQELSSANQRCQLLKQANQKLQSELSMLQSNYQLLQDGSPDAEAVDKMTAELKAVESRLRASASEVTRQGTALKALKSENEQLREEIRDVQDKAGRLERDNAQKKVLLEDLRLKLSMAKESVKSEMATLEQKADEYNKLKLSLERLRTTNQSTKAQLTAVTKERHDYENLYVASRGEVERTAKQLAISQAHCTELQAAIAELEAAAKQQLVALAEQGEAAVEATQRQLLAVHRRSEQLSCFLTGLSAELLLRGERVRKLRRERALLERKRKLQKNSDRDESKALRQAKSQAQRILEISADDLDDLMNVRDGDEEEEEGSSLYGSDDEERDQRKQMHDMHWVKKWQTVVGSKDNFSKELTDLFVKKVDELIEID